MRKQLTALLNSGLFAAAYGFPPRGQDRLDDDDDDDGGGAEEADGLKMSKTMANALAKGLNVEGDDRIIEEHLKWLKKAAERHETALVSPPSQQEPSRVIVLSDSEDDDDDIRRGGNISAEPARPVRSMRRQSLTSKVARAVQAASALPRQLEFASLSSDASRRMSKLGTGLLPPYSNRMPSPFLAAVDDDDITDEGILPRNLTSVDENRDDGLGSPLRLSDAPKSSGATTASASDSLGPRSSSTTVDSEGVRVRRERRQVVPTPELWPPPPFPPRQAMSVPRLPSAVLSDATDMLNMKAAGRGAASSPSRSRQPPVPPPPTSSSDASPPASKRSKGKAKQKARSTSHLRLEASMSAADAATVAAFYRIQRGKIGPGKIVYFDAGDPRLQGRSSVKAMKAAKAAAKAERKQQREKENKAATISPKSFRTVSASVSVSPRA